MRKTVIVISTSFFGNEFFIIDFPQFNLIRRPLNISTEESATPPRRLQPLGPPKVSSQRHLDYFSHRRKCSKHHRDARATGALTPSRCSRPSRPVEMPSQRHLNSISHRRKRKTFEASSRRLEPPKLDSNSPRRGSDTTEVSPSLRSWFISAHRRHISIFFFFFVLEF